jgi:SAM-dependent methyltransferase
VTENGANRVNYDEVSATYDRRYKNAYRPEGIAAALLELAKKTKAECILEVGCGTGHWLNVLQSAAPVVCGMDRSPGMLQKARERGGNFHLIRGDAGWLTFHNATFDLIFCVNTLHHFDNPPEFISEARRLLKQGGALSIIGMNPHSGDDRWFVYDYFPGTRESDLRRYPSPETLADWMIAAGLENVSSRVGERIILKLKGREILPLDKNFTSQLTLLTPQAFADGIARIEAAISEAEALGRTLEFNTDISLAMVTGWVEGRRGDKANRSA